MRKIELKPTEHMYYFSATNYYVGNKYGENYGRAEYETWDDFCESWGDYDLDYNFLVRYDILQKRDSRTDELIDGFQLWLLFILQRKGIYLPVVIHNIDEQDMEDINKTLSNHWEYMRDMWCEFSGEVLKHGD
jgi:hypothetical protein